MRNFKILFLILFFIFPSLVYGANSIVQTQAMNLATVSYFYPTSVFQMTDENNLIPQSGIKDSLQGAITPSKFTISGNPNEKVEITLDAANFSVTNGSMVLENIQSNLFTTSFALNSEGKQDLTLTGTLVISGDGIYGMYNSTIEVSVTYLEQNLTLKSSLDVTVTVIYIARVEPTISTFDFGTIFIPKGFSCHLTISTEEQITGDCENDGVQTGLKFIVQKDGLQRSDITYLEERSFLRNTKGNELTISGLNHKITPQDDINYLVEVGATITLTSDLEPGDYTGTVTTVINY